MVAIPSRAYKASLVPWVEYKKLMKPTKLFGTKVIVQRKFTMKICLIFIFYIFGLALTLKAETCIVEFPIRGANVVFIAPDIASGCMRSLC